MQGAFRTYSHITPNAYDLMIYILSTPTQSSRPPFHSRIITKINKEMYKEINETNSDIPQWNFTYCFFFVTTPSPLPASFPSILMSFNPYFYAKFPIIFAIFALKTVFTAKFPLY